MTRTSTRPYLVIGGIIIVYVALALTYNIVEPIWEAPDEAFHVGFARYIATYRELPKATSDLLSPIDDNDPEKEFSQAPLYYVVLATLLSPIDVPSSVTMHPNPFFTWPNHRYANARAIHRADEGWPYEGVSLYVHLARLVSLLGGIAALLATYRVAAIITGSPQVGMFATAWVGWAPGFILAGARVDNDAAVTAFSALVLLECVMILVATKRSRLRDFAIVGLGLTGALLSKLNGAYLLPLVGLTCAAYVVGVVRCRQNELARVAPRVFLALGVPGCCFLAWWLTIGRTFGNRVGTQAGLGVIWTPEVVVRLNSFRVLDALATWNGTWWDGVGVGFIFGPAVMYVALAIPMVALLASGLWSLIISQTSSGAIVQLERAQRSAAIILLCAAVPLLYLTIARQADATVALDSHMRFTLPAVPVLGLLVGLGGARLPLGGFRRPVALTYLAFILALTIVTPLVLIPQLQVPVVPARLPRSLDELAGPGLVRYANGVDLLDVKASSELIGGGILPVTLRWRVAHRLPRDFIASVQLLGPGDQRLAGADAIPDEHVFPPQLWQAGETVDDIRQLSVPGELVPGTYHLRVGLYYFDSPDNQATPRSILSSNSNDGAARVLSWRILPDVAGMGMATPSEASFDHTLTLRGYFIRRTEVSLQVQAYWVAEKPMDRRIVVSTQILDSAGKLLAQDDHEPVNGNFPTTSWALGEVIRDDHTIPLNAPWDPANRVIVALYDRETSRRLTVSNAKQAGADYLTLQPP